MLVRKWTGFSQAELAKRIDVTSGAINKIESGETKGAKPEILAALGRTLGVSMEWLATGRKGRIAEPESIYGDNASVSQETWRLLTAWEILPVNLQGPLLALVESLAGAGWPVGGRRRDDLFRLLEGGSRGP